MRRESKPAAEAALSWEKVLAHRPDDAGREAAKQRFIEHGVGPELVARHLADTGAELHAAAATGRSDWSAPYGGLLAVALLTGEVTVYCSHLVARASAVRSIAVDSLLQDFSAVSVAADLGISRQKVYEIARGGSRARSVVAEAAP